MLTTTPRVATKILVTTGCRLHVGFTNLSEDAGRRYGSIGVTLDSPRTQVVVRTGDALHVSGEGRHHTEDYVRRFCEHFGVEPRVSVEVRRRALEHVGLGSGTQLALAIGAGLARLFDIDVDVQDIAVALDRGRRSGIGVEAFRTGGFIIDAGRKKEPDDGRAAPTVVFRRDFPPQWRFIIVIPRAERGLNGPKEEGVFRTLTPPARISERICRLTQLKLMPALVEEDIREFGCALTGIDRQTGLFFESAQGGIFSESLAGKAIDVMLSAGAFGAGQSSWGPAVYGLVDGTCSAQVEKEARRFVEEIDAGGRVFVAGGRNTGAKFEVEAERL